MAIVAFIFSIVAIVSWRWRKIFLFISAGLWSIILVANVIEIGLWGKFVSCVDTSLTERLQYLLNVSYYYSLASGRYSYWPWDVSLAWNTMFVKAECCGVGSFHLTSFTSTPWYNGMGDRHTDSIPVQCCMSQTNVHPYETIYETQCSDNIYSGYAHSKGCDDALEDRLKMYNISFFVFMAVIVLAEMFISLLTNLMPSNLPDFLLCRFLIMWSVTVFHYISCIVITIYDAVYLTSEPTKLHEEVKASEGKIKISEGEEKSRPTPISTAFDKKDPKKKKEKENSGNAAKIERKQSIEKQKSFVKQNTGETEKVKDNIKKQSIEETEKENERMRTNTEEMFDSKHLNKTESINDDKKEETDTIDQHKNDETENMHQEEEDKTMKDTSMQITEERASDRTELKDKLVEDVDAEDLVEEDL